MTIIATLYQKKPCPGGHEILIYVYPPCQVHHYYIQALSLSDLCLEVYLVKEKFLKIMHFRYKTTMSTP